MADPVPFSLTIPSEMRLLSVVRQLVEAVSEVGGLDPAAINAVVLAVNEATSNVIRHAHQSRSAVPLQIECRLLEDGIEIRLTDEGPAFDLANVPHLDPSEVRVGGRGVFLMRQLMDELSCQSRPEGGNVLRMVKRCSRTSGPKSRSE
jgi:anti-sigma regulatory factor (Ser/Thr protein kinase)